MHNHCYVFFILARFSAVSVAKCEERKVVDQRLQKLIAKCEERKVVDQRLQKLKVQGSDAENKQEMKNSRSYPEKRKLSLSVFRKATG